MTSESEDEELQRALAMSLERADSPPVALLSDSREINTDREDEELRRAIALSLEESESFGRFTALTTEGSRDNSSKIVLSQYASESSSEPSKQTQRSLASPQLAKMGTTKSGLSGLDRKAMELERLTRLGKRKRVPSLDGPSKLVAEARTKPSDRGEGVAAQPNDIQYAEGVIKRTWANGHGRTSDVTIEEVLQASTTHTAILSAFQWDNVWLFEKLDPYKVKQIWIMNAKGTDVQEKLLGEANDMNVPNFSALFPPLTGQAMNMHGKMMLMFHTSHLRLAVPTANMMNVDWGETSKNQAGYSWQSAVMENSVFLIDLPRRDKNKPTPETPFKQNLIYYLSAQGVGPKVIEGIHSFDFTKTSRLAFVHSIPCAMSDVPLRSTGLASLAESIRTLGLDQVDSLELDYAASSLGALKEPFLEQVYLAACGLPPLTKGHNKLNISDHFRIYFPTRDTVEHSTGGPDCGGIISLNRSYYYAATFPRHCLRDYKSTRAGVLSHNKLLFARGRKRDGSPVAWVYVGSANISEAAWGAQKLLKSGKEGRSILRNWECGAIVSVPEERLRQLALREGEVPPMSVFNGTVEVPFQYPGERYGDKEPWFRLDHHS